jgi:iron complex outermembrane receptor protein
MRKILLALTIVFSNLVIAQNTTVSDTINTLDEVVLNGVRSLDLTPISKTLITRDEVQLTYQGFEVSNIINQTPNITAHNDNGTPFGYTFFRIRGIDQTRINMTLNGVPLNEPEDQGVYFSNYPNFLDNIKSLEIQRGVGTSSNGVSSYAGSINFTSPLGKEENLTIKGTGGSFDTYRVGVTYETGIKNNMSMYFNMSTYSTNGYKYNSGGSGQSVFIGVNYLTSDRDIKFTGFSGRSVNEMAWKPVALSDIEKDPRTNYTDQDANDLFKQSFLQVEHLERFNNYFKLNSSVFYNHLDGGFDYLTYDLGSEGEQNLFLLSHFFGAISNLNYSKDNDNVNVGVSGNFYQREHSYTWANTNTGFKNEFSTFVKYLRTLGDFSVYGDLQYRYVNFDYSGDVELGQTVDWNFLNPKLGVTYSFDKNNELYTSVGKSQREPTRTDLFTDPDGNASDYLLTNSVLNTTSEKVVDYELGYNRRSSNIGFSVNLFYMDFKDEITLSGGISPNGVPRSRTVDDSFRTGVEIDFTYRITEAFTIGYVESYTHSEIENNGETFEPILTPNTIRNLSLKYDRKGILVELISKHHSESYIDLENTAVTPKFTIFNANVGYHNQKFSLMLNVQNLTDKLYFTNGSMVGRDFGPADEPHYFVGNPLSFYVTGKINF